MPAVTPADVQTSPSRMNTGSGSSSTCGKRCRKPSQNAQWVVARWPSSSPAAASRYAPVHTEVVRRACSDARAIQSTTTGSSTALREPSPPATRSVSWRGGGSGSGSTASRMPLLILTWPSVAGPTTSIL